MSRGPVYFTETDNLLWTRIIETHFKLSLAVVKYGAETERPPAPPPPFCKSWAELEKGIDLKNLPQKLGHLDIKGQTEELKESRNLTLFKVSTPAIYI